MLLSYRQQFLFVHTAKTGGTSVRAALESYKWRDPYRIPQFICSRLSHLTGHKLGLKFPRHAKAVTAKEMLPNDVFESLFKFAFVRNPWDLQVSSWHHIRRERPHVLEGINDFETFLRYKLEGDRPYHYILDASVEPQWHHLMDLEGRCIVDFIGRYENLAADFDEVCRRIGFAKPPRLPHKRKAGDREDYRRYYSDPAAELVARHFAADIANLGYTFD
ncbi:sulfotransferase [Thiohalorhabdus denitrificans]|uniref:Sulfotransferase family protein n=1 Tax=Thiohalorhabdus denitrificans TaxID=381306 RepID=A0A0P9C2I0_9GAMM|nr:sulfotransferase family 2 domain-containing protein [Thiohalorhabdus denitrificans]KPV39147.1 sulfotransferase [Thiohalorhabdus denitrificans]SCX76392.1 Sulfotransferase family protein [Thiohalorhabdus denitrificans]